MVGPLAEVAEASGRMIAAAARMGSFGAAKQRINWRRPPRGIDSRRAMASGLWAGDLVVRAGKAHAPIVRALRFDPVKRLGKRREISCRAESQWW